MYYAVVLLQRTATHFQLTLGWRTRFNSLSSYYTIICVFIWDFQHWHILAKQAFSPQQISYKLPSLNQRLPQAAPCVPVHSYSKQSLPKDSNINSEQSSTCLQFASFPWPSELLRQVSFFFFALRSWNLHFNVVQSATERGSIEPLQS